MISECHFVFTLFILVFVSIIMNILHKIKHQIFGSSLDIPLCLSVTNKRPASFSGYVIWSTNCRFMISCNNYISKYKRGTYNQPPLISLYQVYSRRKQFTNYTYRLGKKGGSGMGPVERQFSCQE